MQNKSGFTLVEVLVASLILSVVVFGILRLVNNDTKQASNLEKNNEMYLIYNNSLECIKSFWYNYLSSNTSTQSLNFGSNWDECLTWTYDTNFTFSWIELKSYFDTKQWWSNIYRSYFKTSTWTNFTNINTYIFDWITTKNFTYKLWK